MQLTTQCQSEANPMRYTSCRFRPQRQSLRTVAGRMVGLTFAALRTPSTQSDLQCPPFASRSTPAPSVAIPFR